MHTGTSGRGCVKQAAARSGMSETRPPRIGGRTPTPFPAGPIIERSTARLLTEKGQPITLPTWNLASRVDSAGRARKKARSAPLNTPLREVHTSKLHHFVARTLQQAARCRACDWVRSACVCDELMFV